MRAAAAALALSSAALVSGAPYNPMERIGSMGSNKCEKGKHQILCAYLEDKKGQRLEWNDTSSQTKVMGSLYDVYHKDRGNVTGFEYGKTFLALAQAAFPPSEYPRTLEGGTGSCAVVREMVRRGYDARGHELSSYAVDTFCKGLKISKGMLKTLPYAERHFDMAYSMDVIEHIPEADILPTFKEVWRVLLPGAPFIFNVAPCSSLSGGVAATNIIHASGMCDRFPRTWWNEQLRQAGFESYSARSWRRFEKAAKLRAGELSQTALKSLPANRRFNNRYHNWFFYRVPQSSAETMGQIAEASDAQQQALQGLRSGVDALRKENNDAQKQLLDGQKQLLDGLTSDMKQQLRGLQKNQQQESEQKHQELLQQMHLLLGLVTTLGGVAAVVSLLRMAGVI